MQYMCESECTPLISNGQTILFFKREVGVKIYKTRKLMFISSAARIDDTQKVLKSSQKSQRLKRLYIVPTSTQKKYGRLNSIVSATLASRDTVLRGGKIGRKK